MSTSLAHRWPETVRWGICFALALCFHAAGAAALLARWTDGADQVANAPVIMIALAPMPVAPDVVPNDSPPGPQQAEAQPEPEPVMPIETVELPPAPQAELTVTPPLKPVEKPKDKKPKQKHASLASAPSTAEHKAERAAAPMPGASPRDPNALPNWFSQITSRLERYKRPPSEAPNAAGIARLAFKVDRSGRVHNVRIVRSSGSSPLDRETLMLIQRAQPLPPPPPGVPDSKLNIEVPVRYNMR